MTLSVQLYTMLSMAAMGIYLGAAIDTYGRFQKKKSSFHILVAFNDILFWLIQGLIVFYILLQANNGEIRFYIFLALLCGYACYQALMKNVYQRMLEKIITTVIRMYRFSIRLMIVLIVNPVKYILKVLYSLCIMIVTTIFTVLAFILRIIWKPFDWIISLLMKWTGMGKKVEKLKPLFAKIKGFLASFWKRKG